MNLLEKVVLVKGIKELFALDFYTRLQDHGARVIVHSDTDKILKKLRNEYVGISLPDKINIKYIDYYEKHGIIDNYCYNGDDMCFSINKKGRKMVRKIIKEITGFPEYKQYNYAINSFLEQQF